MSSRALTGSDQDVADDSEANAGLAQPISSNRETLASSQLRCVYPDPHPLKLEKSAIKKGGVSAP